MFKRLDEAERQRDSVAVGVTIDGQTVQCRAGDTVAAALFVSGVSACRDTAVSETPRGPYCMMGVCYDCLVMIDGQANQQGCMTQVREGMKIERQQGARKVQA